jgi:MinD-like ATPase involved in chromosome partitioning or flagellar assembly
MVTADMPDIITVHSFSRGTGKSVVSVNLAAYLAHIGKRVAIVDLNLLTPSLHITLGVPNDQVGYTIQDYLSGICDAEHAPIDVTENVSPNAKGKLFLIPASGDMVLQRLPRSTYSAERLLEGCNQIGSTRHLDLLILDCEAGLTESTLPAIAAADMLVAVMRLDQHDYQGTSVSTDVAARLGVPNIGIVVNMVSSEQDLAYVAKQTQDAYGHAVYAVLPNSKTSLALAKHGMLVLENPNHPLSQGIMQLAESSLSLELPASNPLQPSEHDDMRQP